MNNNNNNENGMNRTRTNNDTSSMPDMVSGEEQPAPGCNFSTAKLRWTKEINKIVMVCYIRSFLGTNRIIFIKINLIKTRTYIHCKNMAKKFASYACND